MRRVAPRGLEPIVSVCRDFCRVLASSVRPTAGPRLAVLALCGVGVVGGAGLGLAQGLSEQQIRCLQLQQDLAAAQGGGGNREDLGRIEQQIAQADRVFQGTRAAMDDAGCFEGFFYPIRYVPYGARLAQDATQCQSNCAAPAELYVYRNPGQEIEQAVSLNGSAYMDLPVALRFRKEFVNGCSCKQAEYNPTEIEAANKRAA